MLELLWGLHFEAGQARLTLLLRLRARNTSQLEGHRTMVGTRAHPSTSPPCLSELPDSRGSKRKLDRPLVDERPACEGAEPSACASAVQPEVGPPSASELRAAQAARARLYGPRPEATQVSTKITPAP